MPTSAKPQDLRNAPPPSQTRENRAPRILAADDQPHILEAIELLLHPQGYRVESATSPAEVREALAADSYDALLIDLNYTRDTTSGQEGLDLLSEIVALDSNLPVIVMTAHGQCWTGRRSHAPRSTRLHPKALGK
jgi:DNA-binding NtrC family response regulator